MSTLYFADGVCNQHTHTHTEALRLHSVRGFGRLFGIDGKASPTVRLQFHA
jgi:hypothetical protein